MMELLDWYLVEVKYKGKVIFMKKYIVTERPLAEERELTINLHLNENGEWEWEVDTNISKYINAFKKRGGGTDIRGSIKS